MSPVLHYDDRTIAKAVFTTLQTLRQGTPNESDRKEQKNQAVELYTYIATWGLIRLQGEVMAMSSKPQKKAMVQQFLQTLGQLIDPSVAQTPEHNPFGSLETGLAYLTAQSASEYLGLTGFALQVAQEFSFWAEAIYHDV